MNSSQLLYYSFTHVRIIDDLNLKMGFNVAFLQNKIRRKRGVMFIKGYWQWEVISVFCLLSTLIPPPPAGRPERGKNNLFQSINQNTGKHRKVIKFNILSLE